MSALGPLVLVMALVIVDRSSLVTIPLPAFVGAGALLILFPFLSRRASRARARQRQGGPFPLPPWKQMFAVHGAVLLIFVVLLLATG